jgi:hypothetical protein
MSNTGIRGQNSVGPVGDRVAVLLDNVVDQTDPTVASPRRGTVKFIGHLVQGVVPEQRVLVEPNVGHPVDDFVVVRESDLIAVV